jgi:hypothetical protein
MIGRYTTGLRRRRDNGASPNRSFGPAAGRGCWPAALRRSADGELDDSGAPTGRTLRGVVLHGRSAVATLVDVRRPAPDAERPERSRDDADGSPPRSRNTPGGIKEMSVPRTGRGRRTTQTGAQSSASRSAHWSSAASKQSGHWGSRSIIMSRRSATVSSMTGSSWQASSRYDSTSRTLARKRSRMQ